MKKANILVVEDQKIISLEIRERLEEMGYNVAGTASTGKQAIQLATSTNPDLILMDIRLEDEMDGIEAAEKIKSFHDCPVVFLTAYADDKTIQRAKITEPYGYIVKPLEERELHSAVEIALYKSKIERKLKDSESKYRTIVNMLEAKLYIVDSDYNVILNNLQVEGLNEKGVEKKCYELIFNRDSICKDCPMDNLTKGLTTRNEKLDEKSSRIYYRISTPMYLTENKIYYQHMMIDITERKRNEDELISILHEKDTLLREIHHRVKNNLQLILSLIRLQYNSSDSTEVKNNLKDIESRMGSMALVHDDLYAYPDFSNVPIKKFIDKLLTNIKRANGTDEKNINITHNIEILMVPVDVAIPIGIIINELVTNSIKYAFNNIKNGEVTISFKKTDSVFELLVKDNGIGYKDRINFKEPKSLGQQIIKSLCMQLGSEPEITEDNGTNFIIKFSQKGRSSTVTTPGI